MPCNSCLHKDNSNTISCDECVNYSNHKEFNVVSNPKHYTDKKIEVIDYIEDTIGELAEGFLIGNVIKYISRYKHKNGLEDLKKSKWYLERLISNIEKEQNNE